MNSAPGHPAISRRSLAAVVSAAAVVIVLVLAASKAAETTSGVFDETIYLDLARRAVVQHDLRGFTDLGVAPLPVRLAWDRPASTPPDRETGDPVVSAARIAAARSRALWWFGVPLLLVVFAWLAATRGWPAGLVAAALLTLSPNIVAHAALATTDIALTATVLIALAALIAYLGAPTAWRGVGVAAALGLALATKYSAVHLFVVAPVLMVWTHGWRRLRSDAAIIVGALLVAWALHGGQSAPLATRGGWAARVIGSMGGAPAADALAALPVPSYVRGLAAQWYLDRRGQDAFLLGQRSQTGWWYYFPAALAMKSTPVEFAAMLAFAAQAVLGRGRNLQSRVLATEAVVFGGLALASHRDLGVRYVLPIVAIAIVGAVDWTADQLRGAPRAGAAAAIAALALQGWSFLSIAPAHLSYFNALAGGPSAGYQRLVDSNVDWGQDLPQLGAWLAAHGTSRVRLSYFGTAPPGAYGIEDVALADDRAADWFALSVTHLQGVFLCGDPFAAFRALAPDARVGSSLLVYAAARPEVAGALDAARHPSCTP